VIKYSLVSMMQFLKDWRHVDLFCNNGIYCWILAFD